MTVYKGIFKRLNATLGGTLSYYWFWTPEAYSWSKPAHNSTEWELAIGDMLAAHAVWKDAGDYPFDLATAGWTLGPKDDPAYLDRVLPADFKALSGMTYDVGRHPDEFGDATTTGYANVTRPSWIMPWLESDDALGWIELWVNRTLDIANRASEVTGGVQGLIGLQWRTKEVMAQFSALAQRAWTATIGRLLARLLHRQLWIRDCGKAAPIFASVDADADSVDGRTLPVFTTCCPGAIKKENKVPWSVYSKQFEFVAALEALRPAINGTANLARYDYWLHTFGYLRSGGQLSCLLSNYTAANKAAMQIADPVQQRRALCGQRYIVPVRQAMVDVWEELTAHQLQAVTTRGAMGTIQNIEHGSHHQGGGTR